MPGLPSDLHQRLCATLTDSGYCDSADALIERFVGDMRHQTLADLAAAVETTAPPPPSGVALAHATPSNTTSRHW